MNHRNIKKHLPHVAGAVLGALAGYLYWKFAGCSSGTCPITSKPLNSSLYGAAAGWILGSLFEKKQHFDTQRHQ